MGTAAAALTTLTELAKQRDNNETRITAAVTEARTHGATWADIGTALGITAQGAHKRWRQPTN